MRIDLTSHDGWGLSWVAAEPAFMQRGSHAVRSDGGVWLFDPVDGDGLEEAIAGLGAVRGVVQLVDRHPRDCAVLAQRLGVPLHTVPVGGVPGLRAEPVVLHDRPWWREVAFWFPEQRALLVGESVGTAPYFRMDGDRVGLHPLARIGPPSQLLGRDPAHLLPGHGAAVSGDGLGDELSRVIGRGRRDLPRSWWAAARSWRR
ncbi:MAG: hypothetical protein AB7O78_04400 [Thermoleophilia bacterium]